MMMILNNKQNKIKWTVEDEGGVTNSRELLNLHAGLWFFLLNTNTSITPILQNLGPRLQ